MTRLEAMQKFLKPYFVEWLNREIQVVEKEPIQELINIIQAIFQQAHKNQADDWQPAYCAVFFLESSLYTKAYDYQICLSNEHLYLDDNRLIGAWTPEFMKRDMEQERKTMRKALSQKFVRIKDYEVEAMFRILMMQYKNMMEVYLDNAFRTVTETSWFTELSKQEPFKFVYGSYMGEIKPIITV